MSDTIKAVTEDYEEYKQLCSQTNNQPVSMYSAGYTFYDHWEDIKCTHSKNIINLDSIAEILSKGGVILLHTNDYSSLTDGSNISFVEDKLGMVKQGEAIAYVNKQ